MKPNDKAYQATRAAILKAMAERNCIIAGVPFNENNYDEFDAGEAVEHAKVALDAAYAAQFQSEEYAGLIRSLRGEPPTHSTLDPLRAADALETVLAERDSYREQLKYFGELHRQEYDRICAERDALLARLAPVEDEALVEIAAKEMDRVVGFSMNNVVRARAAIAAIRPHIEAAERERIADTIKNWGDDPHFQLLAAAIRSGK